MAQDRIRKAAVSTGRDHFRTVARTFAGKGHTLTTDEPEAFGGKDLGPTPLEMFLASIGSCKTMTVRMYADRKGWPLEEAVCTVEADYRVREGGGPTKIPHIDITIEFKGDLTDEQRQRLYEIADRCPVQRIVTGECVVSSTLGRNTAESGAG